MSSPTSIYATAGYSIHFNLYGVEVIVLIVVFSQRTGDQPDEESDPVLSNPSQSRNSR
jgi:hypothetical protein